MVKWSNRLKLIFEAMFTPLTNQQSFSNIELSSLSKSKTAEFLNEVNKKIDWSKIERILQPTYCKDNGRPSLAPSILFKGLLLEQWYDLSDKALEEELKDRLSFRNFVNLKSNQDAPDETTFVRFRQKLRETNLEEQLFNFIRDELRKDNLEIKSGKCLLNDASLIESPYGVKPKGRDGNGTFIVRDGQVKKGYKIHLAVNQKDELAETVLTTVATCHESYFLEKTLEKVEGNILAVIADKGYASNIRKKEFRQKGIYCGVLEKRWRNQKPLSKKQIKKNKILSKVRAPIERVFAVIKKHYGFSKVRYFGLERNASHVWNVLTAYNLQLIALRSLKKTNTIPIPINPRVDCVISTV